MRSTCVSVYWRTQRVRKQPSILHGIENTERCSPKRDWHYATNGSSTKMCRGTSDVLCCGAALAANLTVSMEMKMKPGDHSFREISVGHLHHAGNEAS